MTSPTPDEVRLDDLTAQQDAELIAAEQAAQAAVVNPLETDLMRLTLEILVAWELLRDDESPSKLLASLRQGLRGISLAGVRSALLQGAHSGFELGVAQGVAQAALPHASVPIELPRVVREVIDAAPATARGHLNAAIEAATTDLVRSRRDLEDVLARARQAVTSTNRTTAFVVTRSVATGVEAMANKLGAGRLWVGERDACVHCLAYFGEVALMGEPFPSGLTFGRKPLKQVGPVWNPGLHPHCRCRVVVWMPRYADGGVDYPAALKREARRSIARGWSLESESNSVRVDAAARLLARVAGSDVLPKSVEDYSARAVKTGVFPRGRTFPGRAPVLPATSTASQRTGRRR